MVRQEITFLIMIYEQEQFLCVGLLHGKWFKTGIDSCLGNDHILGRFVSSISLGSFHLAYNIHTLNHFTEDNMSAIQPGSFLNGDEKLGSIGVFTSVGHGQPAGTVMLELEVFVSEAFAINGASTSTISTGEISSLDHEILDNAMEFGSLVPFTCGLLSQLVKVIHSPGNSLAKESNFDIANGLSSNLQAEGDSVGHLGSGGLGLGLRGQEGEDQKGNGKADENLHGCFGYAVRNATPGRCKEVLCECELGHDCFGVHRPRC